MIINCTEEITVKTHVDDTAIHFLLLHKDGYKVRRELCHLNFESSEAMLEEIFSAYAGAIDTMVQVINQDIDEEVVVD